MVDEHAGASPAREASPVALIGETVAANGTAEASRPWEPTQPDERIDIIDVLRGLALFGIIAANMRGFAGPLYTYFRPEVMWNTHLDFWVQAFVDTFIQGKFIVIFAFLFGVGFALQFIRAEKRHGQFIPVYRRRLLALILIGGLHQLLFWWGDVLVTYALGGFLMIWFRKRKSKTILIWVLSLMFAPMAGGLGYLGFRHFRPVPAQKVEANRIKAENERQKSLEEMRTAVKVYQAGTYAAIYKERLGELWHENRSQPFVVVMTLPVFMLGLLVYRLGIFQNPEAHRTALKKALIIGAVVGIPANVASTYVMHITGGQMQSGPPEGLKLFGFFLFIFGRPALSMCYASAVVLLFLNERWRPRLKPFSVIGRTALSNYLFQTIFCTTIFFGYGGGLFAKAHLAWLIILSVAVYALEVALSKWWLARYRFGPAEWAWRSLTYGRLQPMKI
jgi:uncharacterized protein